MKIIKTKKYRKSLRKVALPIYQPSSETKSKMYQEHTYLLQDMIRILPNTKIKELKRLLSGLGGIEGISLPKIFYLEDKNIVSYDGKKYYYLHHELPKKKKKEDPGKLWLLDLKTAIPIELPYKGTIEKLGLLDEERKEQVREAANEAIRGYNSKVDKLDGDREIGLVTIPLRVQRILPLVDKRLAELNGQVQAIESQPEYGTEGVEQFRTKSIEALRSGELLNNDRDAIDTALLWYSENPEKLLNDLPTFNISELAKQSLVRISDAEIANKAKEIERKKQKWDERQNRMEGEFPEIEDPSLQPIPEIEPGTQPRGSPNKPMGYRSFEAREFQKSPELKEISFNIEVLEKVRDSLQKINAQIAGMQKGEFTEEYLRSREGAEVLKNMTSLLDSALGFIKKYSQPIFSEEGKVNPKLFGPTGGMGNVELVIEMGRVYNAIRLAVKSRGEKNKGDLSTTPERVPVEGPPAEQPSSALEPSIAGGFIKVIKTAAYIKMKKKAVDDSSFDFEGVIRGYNEATGEEIESDVRIQGTVYSGEERTWDYPGSSASIEVEKVIDLRTNTEIPEEVFEKHTEDLEQQSWDHVNEMARAYSEPDPDVLRDEQMDMRAMDRADMRLV